MRSPWGDLSQVRRPVPLVAALLASGILALGIHVLMLDLGDPYPTGIPPFWLKCVFYAIKAAAVIVFLRLGAAGLSSYRPAGKFLLVFLIVFFINENLRVVLMNGFSNKQYFFALLDLPQRVIMTGLLTLVCLIAGLTLRKLSGVMLASMAIGVLYQIVLPHVTHLFGPLIDRYNYLDLPNLYTVPYPISFQIPAFSLFLEPVLGALLLTILVWNKVGNGLIVKSAVIAVLVSAIRGNLQFMLYSPYMVGPPAVRLLSYGQFSLEFIGLGLFVTASWWVFGRSGLPHGQEFVSAGN